MRAHGTERIRLDLRLEHCPLSLNVAAPAGLLVNELLTNALKYAFEGRGKGIVTLQCLRMRDDYVRIEVTDEGVGLPAGVEWPPPGKLITLIIQTLRENAGTDLHVESIPGEGMSVTINLSLKPRLPGKIH